MTKKEAFLMKMTVFYWILIGFYQKMDFLNKGFAAKKAKTGNPSSETVNLQISNLE